MAQDHPPRDASEPSGLSRRGFLGATAGAAALAAGAGVGTTAAAEEPAYGDWFGNTSNYDGTVDKTGQSEVTVEVGASGNNGNFAFGPPAVHVDPGTTVTWKWTGAGGSHNVVAEDGSFESELVGENGHTFSHTFEESGIYRYYCAPHEPMGMKGAVAVGDVETTTATSASDESAGDASGVDFGGWFEKTSNFDGVVDETGASDVTVTVGADGNNGTYAFGPAAVRVDPGTTVTWEWSGNGGSHNVVAEDGSFESEMVGENGHTFSHTFESEGVYRYYCGPHEPMGMKGAVVVGTGDPAAASGHGGDGGLLGGVDGESALVVTSFVAAFCSPVAFAALLFGWGESEETTDHRQGHVPGD